MSVANFNIFQNLGKRIKRSFIKAPNTYSLRQGRKPSSLPAVPKSFVSGRQALRLSSPEQIRKVVGQQARAIEATRPFKPLPLPAPPQSFSTSRRPISVSSPDQIKNIVGQQVRNLQGGKSFRQDSRKLNFKNDKALGVMGGSLTIRKPRVMRYQSGGANKIGIRNTQIPRIARPAKSTYKLSQGLTNVRQRKQAGLR